MAPKRETLFYSTDGLELMGREQSRTRFGGKVRVAWFAEEADDGVIGSFEVIYSLRSPQMLLGSVAIRPDWRGEIFHAVPNLPAPMGLHALRRFNRAA